MQTLVDGLKGALRAAAEDVRDSVYDAAAGVALDGARKAQEASDKIPPGVRKHFTNALGRVMQRRALDDNKEKRRK